MSIAKEHQTPLTNNSSVVESRLRTYDSIYGQVNKMAKRPPEDMKVLATQKQRLTLSINPQMAGQMGHFRLTGSPRCKNFKPRRKLQYEKSTPNALTLCTM